jgi:acyl-CoA reductase-like NAD-dependent aldehyde dehydrogenase
MTIERGAAGPTSELAEHGDVDLAAVDAALARVARSADRWASTSPAERVALLARVIADTAAASDAWLAAACEAKGLDPASNAGSEERFSGIGTLLTMASALKRSIGEIAETGRPQFPGPVREARDGRLVVGVFPARADDRLLMPKVTAEVWIEPGVTRAELEADQAPAYRDPRGHQGLAVVLAGGNVASLGPRDVLSQLFVEGRVVLLKANPVNDYLIPHWRRALASLIEAGVLEIVAGGAAVGKHLCAHELVDAVHVTGSDNSDKTFDAIVYGTGPDGERRKAADEPVLSIPVTGELGSVSPIIVVPGEWSVKDLAFQAEHVATMLVNNAGFNCLAARVLVTWRGWEQRQAFLAAVEEVLRREPTRRAYYPGAVERHRHFLEAHPEALELGAVTREGLAWTLIEDVDPADTGDICFNVEAFCSLMAETALDAPSPAAFVDAAVSFANDVIWGSLSATVLAHPSSLADPELGPRVEAAIEDLHFGGIGLNLFHGFVFALGWTTWGAYPGHPRNDIQSGCGVVGNAYLLTRTQKSVVRGPFRASPRPAWFCTARNGPATMGRLLDYYAAPSALKLPGLVLAALRN